MSQAHLFLVIEMVATILGLISVYLLTVGKGLGWSLGGIWIVLTAVVFWNQSLYGSVGLQAFFLLTQILGWWRWKTSEGEDLRASSRGLSFSWQLGLFLLYSGSWYFAWRLLQQAESVAPLFDSFVTVGSILAQGLMVYNYRECWLLWLLVDIVYVALNLQLELWFFVFLYLVFCLLAVNGWRQWTRDPE